MGAASKRFFADVVVCGGGVAGAAAAIAAGRAGKRVFLLEYRESLGGLVTNGYITGIAGCIDGLCREWLEKLDAEGHARSFTDNQKNALGVNPQNPRCAIGYYEPGHYCLIEIEGNRWGCFIGSYGLSLSEKGALFEEMGCKSAYNLDGGRSAAMSWMGELLTVNYGRDLSDVIYISDTPIGSEGGAA